MSRRMSRIERDGWPDVGDVGKVLIGTHADATPRPGRCAAPARAGLRDTSARWRSGCRYRVAVRFGERGDLCREEGPAPAFPDGTLLRIQPALRRQRAPSPPEDRIVSAPPNSVSQAFVPTSSAQYKPSVSSVNPSARPVCNLRWSPSPDSSVLEGFMHRTRFIFGVSVCCFWQPASS